MDIQNLNNTEADALGMAYSLALKTLMDQMVDPNLDACERRWAAEAILKHDETYDTTTTNGDK